MGESADFIDYTLLQKKGTLERAQRRSSASNGSSPNPLASFMPSPSALSSNTEGGLFGFMDASVSNASSSSSSPVSPDISALTIKVDDLSYKLERLTEQLALLEAKLGSVSGNS